MSARKIFLVLIAIIFFVILSLNYGNDVAEPAQEAAVSFKNPAEKNTKALPSIPQAVNTQVTSIDAKKDDDIGIFACLPEFTFDEEAKLMEIEQYFQSLDDTNLEAASRYYALYAKPLAGQSRLDLLFEYHRQFGNSPIISIDLISLCASSADERCTVDFINQMTASDSDNGAVWLSTASYYAAKGDDLGVMDTIDALGKTSVFNERFGEKALLYTQALEGSTANHFNENVPSGINRAVASLPPFLPITKWCQQGLEQPGKAKYCLMLGQQLETRSKTLISKMIGLALQGMVFDSDGDTDAIQLMEQKKKKLIPNLESEASQKATIMMILDERLTRSWLNNLDSYGELESRQLLTEEAEGLYEANENQLCTLIHEALGVIY